MSLLLTVYNTPAWSALTEISGLPVITDAPLAIAVGDALLQPVQPLSMVPTLLLQLPTGQSLLLAAVQAEYFLANAIESGSNLKEAAAQWEQQTKVLLTLQSQKRRQLKLFNLHQALTQPAAFRNSLGPAVTISDYEPQPGNSNLALLAACQYLAQRTELQALNTRLQASVLPLCDSEALGLDIDQILQHCQANTTQLVAISDERDQLQRQLTSTQQQMVQATAERHRLLQAQQQNEANLGITSEERDLILQQLHQVQEQLEREEQASAKQLAALTDERDQLQHQLSSLQQQCDQANSECQWLKHVEQQSEITLKAATEERDQAQGQLKSLQQQLDQATVECKRLQQAQQRSDADLKATSEERDLILSQLHETQEQLEHYSQAHLKSEASLQAVSEQSENYYRALQAEQQSSKHAALAHEKQQERERAKFESELRKTQARAASAEYAGQLLQEELARLRGSISWKVAKPVRVLGRFVKKTDKDREKLLQETALLLTSEYFDVDWYLRIYPDVAESNMNPAEHYLLYGTAEGRLPGPLFDGNWYLQQYPDVAAAGINPLLHFIKFGQQEGRNSSPKLLTSDTHAAEVIHE